MSRYLRNHYPKGSLEIKQHEEQVKRIWGNSERFLDQVITSLSVGLLGFTIVFSDKFKSAGNQRVYLQLFWFFLFISVVSVVIGNFVNTFACPHELERLDLIKKRKLPYDALQEYTWETTIVIVMNYTSTVTFITSLVFLALFTLIQ